MKVQCIRLTTGEDIIARVNNDDSAGFTAEDPAQLFMNPTEKGMSIGMAPFLSFAASREFYFPNKAVLFTYDPAKELAQQYSANFGSRIALAQPGDLAGMAQKIIL